MRIVPFFPCRKGTSERPGEQATGETELASIARGPLAGRFCAWLGASDTRYVTSVYAVDHRYANAGLPDFAAYVLIAVARRRAGRTIVGVATIERSSDRAAAVSFGLSRGADEWHVHFLAEDRPARAAAVADLRARHTRDIAAARCA